MTATMERTSTDNRVEAAQDALSESQVALRALRRRVAEGDKTITARALREAQDEINLAEERLVGAMAWEREAPAREALAVADRCEQRLRGLMARQDELIRRERKAQMEDDALNAIRAEVNAEVVAIAAELRPALPHLPEGRAQIEQVFVRVGDAGMCRWPLHPPVTPIGRFVLPGPPPPPAPPAAPVCVDRDGQRRDKHMTLLIDDTMRPAHRGGRECQYCGKKWTRQQWAAEGWHEANVAQ